MQPSGDEPPKPRKRRPRVPKEPNRLESLPLELLSLILSYLPLPSLLALSLTSKPLRNLVLAPQSEPLWQNAVKELEWPQLEEPLKPVEVAWLTNGRWCRTCHRNNGRKVDFFLRVRLCSKCWDEQIVYEGPDEPDPAFEEFFAGTKRYTPRSRTGKSWKRHKAFFLLPTLLSTSSYLSTLFAPQLSAYDSALETDPLAELDDFLAFSSLPFETQQKLDKRQEWVKRILRDGQKMVEWEKGVKEREKREREVKKLAKELAEQTKEVDEQQGQHEAQP
ncbi:hypothetical protein JCM8547_008770 [Rhodosporidiobolus lusitaniae]